MLERVRPAGREIVAEIFGERIDALHEAMGEDAPGNGPGQTFAVLVGCNEGVVSRWRTGKRRIRGWVWLVLNCFQVLYEIGGREAVSRALFRWGELRYRWDNEP